MNTSRKTRIRLAIGSIAMALALAGTVGPASAGPPDGDGRIAVNGTALTGISR